MATWKEAIILVLAERGHPRHYRDIARRIDALGFKPHRSDDVNRTVSKAITRSINEEGAASPFIRTEPGVYTLRRDFPLEDFLNGR